MFQFVKNDCWGFFFVPTGVREMLGISLGKRLQWAEISFSGTCHESRYEAPFGEAENILFFTSVDRCG